MSIRRLRPIRQFSSLPKVLLSAVRRPTSFPLPPSSLTSPLLRGRCYGVKCCFLRGGVRLGSSSNTGTGSSAIGEEVEDGSSNAAAATTIRRGNSEMRSICVEDFFGERVTFFLQSPPTAGPEEVATADAKKPDLQRINDAIQALDTFQLSVITRGKSNFSEGGDSDGDSVQASHASAVAWVDLLIQALAFHKSSSTTHSTSTTNNNNTNTSSTNFLACPMLTVVAVAPLLCQTGVQYVKYLDKCLRATIPSSSTTGSEFSFLLMVQHTLQQLQYCNHNNNNDNNNNNNNQLLLLSSLVSPREKLHLEALHLLMQDRHRDALSVYLKLLTLHPGDILALTLAIDVAYVIGESKLALRAATSVSQYIQERRQRGPSSLSTYFISGYNVAFSWVSLGLALGGKYREAETMAQSALGADSSSTGGISTATLCTVYDAEGRITEGCSLLIGYDGIQNYKDCGWLTFDCKLAGYGARFILDRDGGDYGGDTALRVYDDYFSQRLATTSTTINHSPTQRASPQKTPSLVSRAVQAGKAKGKTVLQSMFGIGDSKDHHHNDNFSNNPFHDTIKQPNTQKPYIQQSASFRSSLEDLLTFLPPTPQLLVHATLLLLRITLAGVIATDDERWVQLREAWRHTMSELQDSDNINNAQQPLQFFPLADALSALVVTDTISTTTTDEENVFSNTLKFSCSSKQGLYELGKLLALGISSVPSSSSSSSSAESMSPSDVKKVQEVWSRIVSLLASTSEGRGWAISDATSSVEARDIRHHLAAFEQDLRPILNHALCHAALLSKSYESLSVARAICSEDVTLRPNCADSWWRYSLILDELGDTVAAENARMAFTSFGSGVRRFKSVWTL